MAVGGNARVITTEPNNRRGASVDGQRIDRIVRSLANGLSRRAAMKTAAVALGLSAAGAHRASIVAAPKW